MWDYPRLCQFNLYIQFYFLTLVLDLLLQGLKIWFVKYWVAAPSAAPASPAFPACPKKNRFWVRPPLWIDLPRLLCASGEASEEENLFTGDVADQSYLFLIWNDQLVWSPPTPPAELQSSSWGTELNSCFDKQNIVLHHVIELKQFLTFMLCKI